MNRAQLKAVQALLAIAALHLASGASAEESKQAKPLDQVIVIGSKPIDVNVLERAATPFIRSHGAQGRISGQIARWKRAICPQTRGLSPAYNKFVTDRIREIAGDVGAPVEQRDPCMPNIEIIFTTEPQKLLDNVARDHEILLGFHFNSQLKKLATFS